METFEEDNPKNIYVIRRKLAALKAVRGHYEYPVGNYTVHIYTYSIQDVPDNLSSEEDNLLKHEKFHVVLNVTTKSGVTSSISLRDDPLFKDYEPIQYDVISTPTGGRINLSSGENMPIGHLCELIRYLHRLSNLTAFM
jgi:hypothetical protein